MSPEPTRVHSYFAPEGEQQPFQPEDVDLSSVDTLGTNTTDTSKHLVAEVLAMTAKSSEESAKKKAGQLIDTFHKTQAEIADAVDHHDGYRALKARRELEEMVTVSSPSQTEEMASALKKASSTPLSLAAARANPDNKKILLAAIDSSSDAASQISESIDEGKSPYISERLLSDRDITKHMESAIKKADSFGLTEPTPFLSAKEIRQQAIDGNPAALQKLPADQKTEALFMELAQEMSKQDTAAYAEMIKSATAEGNNDAVEKLNGQIRLTWFTEAADLARAAGAAPDIIKKFEEQTLQQARNNIENIVG